MRTDDRARYKNIGDTGDAILNDKTVSIVGLGAVGATMASIIGREGITMRMVDMGRVEEADMHRLSLFYEEDITKFKVKQAKVRIAAINPTTQVKSFHEELSENNIFLLKGDCIIDASNDDEVNDLTFRHAQDKKIPIIIVRYCGDQARILVAQKKLPLKTLKEISLGHIEEEGVFGPVTSMAASTAVSHLIQLLLDDTTSMRIELDAWKTKAKVTKL